MNANSSLQTPAIKDWLNDAYRQLSDIGVPSARLDAEILLAHALNKNRTYLPAHNTDNINKKTLTIADNYLLQRLNRVPTAYIIGYKEFYGRKFIVNPDTLIPRPESEDIITTLKQILPSTIYYLPSTTYYLVDVGTGSGCLGITAKLEFPNLDVTLTDISSSALVIAKKNAIKLSAKVNFVKSDLLITVPEKADIIIANLPYVDKSWERSIETDYEPPLALLADDNGLSIIKKLITSAPNSLKTDGYLIIESDPVQHHILIEHAKKNKLLPVHQLGYIIAFKLNKD